MSIKFGKSFLRGQYPIRLKGNIMCANHLKNEVLFSCKDCNALICIECSITTHKKHSLAELTKIAKEQKSKLQYLVDNTDDVMIPKIKEEIILSKNELSTYQPKYETLSDNIIKRRDQCKLELDQITDEYLTTCHKMKEDATNLLVTRITNLEGRLDTLVKLSSESKQTLQTGTVVLVYDSVSDLQDKNLDVPHRPNTDMAEFIPGRNMHRYLERAVGKMKIPDHLQTRLGSVARQRLPRSTDKDRCVTEDVLYKLRKSPAVISQFSYPSDITSICPTSDGGAWLCDFDSNEVHLISNRGEAIQTIQHRRDISHISLAPTTGHLWFCCVDERSIYEVSASSTPVARFKTKGDPYSLRVTREGRVVVGIRESEGYKLVLYTADGRVLQEAIVEPSNRGFIRSIAECALTGNIALVSTQLICGDFRNPDNYRRRVIVYNPIIRYLFDYEGDGMHKQETYDKPFDPITVVYDSKGYIVIADQTRNTIELVSGAGKYIKTLHRYEGRQGPVDIQKDDVLWSDSESDTLKDGLKLIKYYLE